MELCKIGDYQDYLYKENGIWYKYGAIGKYEFTGNENWQTSSYGTNSWISNLIGTIYDTSKTQIISNIFRGCANDDRGILGDNLIYTTYNTTFTIRNTTFATLEEVRNATNGNYIYYYMATPTITPITDTTLIEQLDNLEKAYSYDTQTNISQTNQDKPFIISYEAILSLRNILEI